VLKRLYIEVVQYNYGSEVQELTALVRLASFTTNILAPESKKPRDIKAKDIART
jgi:hypothetical protein